MVTDDLHLDAVDRGLIAEALVHWAGADPATPRQLRAWTIAVDFAEQQGHSVDEYIRQDDPRWSGPGRPR